MSAEVRQHPAEQIFVLKIQLTPSDFGVVGKKVDAEGVRVARINTARIKLERRIWIRRTLAPSQKSQRVLPHLHLLRGERAGQQKSREQGSHKVARTYVNVILADPHVHLTRTVGHQI